MHNLLRFAELLFLVTSKVRMIAEKGNFETCFFTFSSMISGTYEIGYFYVTFFVQQQILQLQVSVHNVTLQKWKEVIETEVSRNKHLKLASFPAISHNSAL
jgi:hypothetical protein